MLWRLRSVFDSIVNMDRFLGAEARQTVCKLAIVVFSTQGDIKSLISPRIRPSISCKTMASKISHTPQPSFSSTADTIVEKQTRLGDGFFDDHSSAKPSPTLPPVIPPTHQRRTLIVCFDGTGDQFDADNSNVVQFVSLLKKDDRHGQRVYYQV